jgi:hypothetical protein
MNGIELVSKAELPPKKICPLMLLIRRNVKPEAAASRTAKLVQQVKVQVGIVGEPIFNQPIAGELGRDVMQHWAEAFTERGTAMYDLTEVRLKESVLQGIAGEAKISLQIG